MLVGSQVLHGLSEEHEGFGVHLSAEHESCGPIEALDDSGGILC